MELNVFLGLPMTETDVLAQLEEPQLPHVNVGRDFQTELPELCNNRVDLHRAPEQLLWDPGINDALDDNEGKKHIVLFLVGNHLLLLGALSFMYLYLSLDILFTK